MIVVLGMAGAGKSTLCGKLVADGDYQWFALGEVLRARETGKDLAEMAQGKVLDDALVTPIVTAELNRLGDSPEILLDGCPRTVGQAKWLAAGLNTPKVSCLLHLVVDDNTAIKRLVLRGRADDTGQAMKLRFAGYHRDIELVLDEFRSKGVKICEVDASQDEHSIVDQAYKCLGKIS